MSGKWDKTFLIEKLSRIASNITITELQHYWIAACQLKEP